MIRFERFFSFYSGMQYTVVAGDTLYSIAKKFDVKLSELTTSNSLSGNDLQLGQTLTIPLAGVKNSTIYIVQAGDSLFRIAQRYNTNIEAIKGLNELSSNALKIGQRLRVPDVDGRGDASDGQITPPSNIDTPTNTNTNTNSNSTNTNNSTTGSGIDDTIFTPPSSNTKLIYYTVKSGDSLFKIAQKHHSTIAAIRQLNNLPTDLLAVGQRLKIEVSESPSTSTIYTSYVVKSGDSLYKIAQLHSVSVEVLKSINGLTGNNLFIGQKLRVPSGGNTSAVTTTYTVLPGDSLARIAQHFNTSVELIINLNNLTNNSLFIGQRIFVPILGPGHTAEIPAPPAPIENSGYSKVPIIYVVKGGDTLNSIAERFGTTASDIRQKNKLRNDNLLVGQKLIVGEEEVQMMPNVRQDLEYKPTLKITGSVGKNGQNFAEDVLMVQNRLIELNFAEQSTLQSEMPAEVNKEKLADASIPNTIFCIEKFESTLLSDHIADALLLPDSSKLMLLDIAIPSANEESQFAIRQNLLDFQWTFSDGAKLFDLPLQDPVGETTTGNYADDINRVQERLVQLGYLAATHGESVNHGGVSGFNKISKTIQAIKKFQERKVKYWAQHEQWNTDLTYTFGIINPNDLTFNFLKNYQEHQLQFNTPDSNQPIANVVFKNFVRSPFTINTDGIAYLGTLSPRKLPLHTYLSLGLSAAQARALQYVSQHEGNFDALNTYDKAILSYGFIQFAGGNRGLAPLLSLIKNEYPKEFEFYFQRYGIDVEYSIEQGKIKFAQIVLIDANDGSVLRSENAEKRISADKRLLGAFLRASYDPVIQKAQIRSAQMRYVLPALEFLLNFSHNVNGQWILIDDVPIQKIIRSEMGITILIDITVNQWVVKARDHFTHAIKAVATQKGITSTHGIYNIDEKALVKEIIKVGDSRVKYRVADIYQNSGLSTYKTPI